MRPRGNQISQPTLDPKIQITSKKATTNEKNGVLSQAHK